MSLVLLWSVCCWLMELDTDKTKIRSTMLAVYCLNQTKRWYSYVHWPTSLLLLNVPYYYITLQLVLSKNMCHVCSNIMTANANWLEYVQQKSASLCFTCFSSSYFLQLYLCTFSSETAYFMIQEASNWQPFFIHS